MTATQQAHVVSLVASFLADRPKQSVSDYCCQSLRFAEPKNSGPYSLAGREYTREILDSWADSQISDMVLIFGSQAGKTGTLMGGAAWTIKHNPSRFLWVMPTRDLCRDFSRNRWMSMLLASPEFAALIPTGARRHDFSTLQQVIGSALVGFAWSNSPTALSSNPCDVVILDEVDKFNEGGTREADAVNLADQRTKNTANPKRVKTTTPTLSTGLGWREFLKTDQRRRFVPCPHCGKHVVFIWSKAYTVFKSTGCEAEVKWDKEAKRPDGSWDLDRVERSGRLECPHCAGHITDGHKSKIDRAGEWRPTPSALRLSIEGDGTGTAARGYRGWHLPSLYASAKETNIGRLAVKFLQAKQSLEGLQGFINGDLAEPYESQDTVGHRVEIVTEKLKDDLTGRTKLMTVDVQKDGYWFVVAIWGTWNDETTGKPYSGMHTIDAGHLDSWDEVENTQSAHGIKDVGVTIDSGDQTKGTGDSVYIQCATHCEYIARRDGLPLAEGWKPSKGMPGHKRWKDEKSGAMLPYRETPFDPFDGTSRAGMVVINVFQFSADYFKDILAAMRNRKGQCRWSVEKAVATDEFWKHMDGEYKGSFYNRKTRRVQEGWIKRGRHWPNHIFDCENIQVARATSLGLLKID